MTRYEEAESERARLSPFNRGWKAGGYERELARRAASEGPVATTEHMPFKGHGTCADWVK